MMNKLEKSLTVSIGQRNDLIPDRNTVPFYRIDLIDRHHKGFMDPADDPGRDLLLEIPEGPEGHDLFILCMDPAIIPHPLDVKDFA